MYALALLSALCYGAADFIGGLASRRASTLAVVASSQAAGFALLVVLLPVLPAAAPSRPDLAWGAAAGLGGGVGVALLYRALAIGTMAVVAPVTAVCAVIIPVAAGVLLGERPHPWTLAGIGLALVSIVLVSQSPPEQGGGAAGTSRRSLVLAFASGVAIGLFFLALARTDPAAGLLPLLAARATSSTLFVVAALAARVPVRMPRQVLGWAIGAGVVDMAANAFYLLAAQQGPLSVVVTLASLYPASTVVLARVALGERLAPVQYAGVLCALVAVGVIVAT